MKLCCMNKLLLKNNTMPKGTYNTYNSYGDKTACSYEIQKFSSVYYCFVFNFGYKHNYLSYIVNRLFEIIFIYFES